MFIVKKSKNISIIISILLAAIIVSGSLIFLGIQISKSNNTPSPNAIISQEAIEKGIETYIAKQNKDQQKTQRDQEEAAKEKAKNVPPVTEKDHVRGNRDALVSLIEYSDFECPFCKKFHPTAQEFLNKNSDNVNWVYRHFPLGFHDPLATEQAEASECANQLGGNDQFWAYTDKIYETTKSNGNGMKNEDLISIAEELGLNKQNFIACMESDIYLDRIRKDIAGGIASGVTGTPGNILRNNKTGEVRFIPGAYPLEALEKYLDELL